MTDNLQVRKVKMRIWKGSYEPNVILLREGMTQEEETRTLKHELLHHNFYVKHKWSKPFFHFRFRLIYTVLAFLILPYSALAYFILITPLLLLSLHETYVSALTQCWRRMLEAMFVFSLLIAFGGLMQ